MEPLFITYMKKKKKKRIMPCVEGIIHEGFERHLHFDPGCLCDFGVLLLVSYEKGDGKMNAELSIYPDEDTPEDDLAKTMDSLSTCMAAGKADGIRWVPEESAGVRSFNVYGESFDALHRFLAPIADTLDDGHIGPLLRKMADVAGAFAVEYDRFTKWREEVWNKSC